MVAERLSLVKVMDRLSLVNVMDTLSLVNVMDRLRADREKIKRVHQFSAKTQLQES